MRCASYVSWTLADVNDSFTGQIFCSRCASNIIKGHRFGHEGMLRVCNLCLDQVAKVGDDDEDDRRSIVSGATSSFPAHQFGADSFSMGHGYQPSSPFSASQLFGRGDEPFSLFSIAEAKRAFSTAGSEDSGFDSRAPSPSGGRDDVDADNVGIPIRSAPAPFRRGVADDDKEPVSINEPDNPGHSSAGARSKTPVEFPTTVSVSAEGPSSIQFPITSPDQPYGADGPMSAVRSRYNSLTELDGNVPFIRSRVHSLLDSVIAGEPGWRTRRESIAYVVFTTIGR
jgi:1-phosphatidylinositol-3-phosphate 5-kinase